MECLTYCIASKIDLSRLDNYYKTSGLSNNAVRFRDVLKLKTEGGKQVIFIFRNGTIVSWGVKRHHIHDYIETIKQFAEKPIPFEVHDEFICSLGDRTAIEPHGYFEVDCLSIDRTMDTDDLKLSLSYGFSQSVKLQYFETILEALIDKYTPLIHSISAKGQMKVKRKQLRKIVGELLGAKSEMNLISNFLYHPKYFWQHPSLEEYYIMLERYLHIQRRVNAINHRLDTLNEIFDMFNSYLENRHSHHLEIIIIILIAIETIFSAMNFHF
ncbi:MAG: RMD1 family protein [Gammaproteobacteria bacterium]|nr:RMD1 family protein [Gammaproteobacteria bacterium]